MKYFAPVRIRIEKDVVTLVTRVLRGKGTLNVNVGQQVSPEEIIGTGEVTSGFRTLNLSTLLSVAPEQVEKFLIKQIGQRIYQGELLAYRKGGFFTPKKQITSPTDGILDFFNNKTGELKISLAPRKADLPAGVYGIIDMVDQSRGQVMIRTQVSRIYGICGSGRSRDGILHILGKKDELVPKNMIQNKFDGQILVGGSLFFKDTISASISAGVSGIIIGGINATDYKGMAGGRLSFPKKLDNDIGISIIVCEGFGSIPLGNDIFDELKEYEGRFVFIDGNKAVVSLPSPVSSSLIKVKNTGIPMQQTNDFVSGNPAEQILQLSVGMKVRVVGNYYLAAQGKLLAVDDSPTLLPSGIKTCLATVETASKKIQVPVANLEVMM
ncbi:hypothetical protein HYT74_01925 [Candidatus Daviesbacteria bacterium]|nr:hypothetical protein [Candidatus Daviesbacteria bacterium]